MCPHLRHSNVSSQQPPCPSTDSWMILRCPRHLPSRLSHGSNNFLILDEATKIVASGKEGQSEERVVCGGEHLGFDCVGDGFPGVRDCSVGSKSGESLTGGCLSRVLSLDTLLEFIWSKVFVPNDYLNGRERFFWGPLSENSNPGLPKTAPPAIPGSNG